MILAFFAPTSPLIVAYSAWVLVVVVVALVAGPVLGIVASRWPTAKRMMRASAMAGVLAVAIAFFLSREPSVAMPCYCVDIWFYINACCWL